jgi:hypothetical protein
MNKVSSGLPANAVLNVTVGRLSPAAWNVLAT